MLETAGDTGLICGYAARAPGSLHAVEWRDVHATIATRPPVLWLHFNLADQRSQQFIARCDAIPEAGRAFLLEREQRIRFEHVAGGVAGALTDFRVDTPDDPSETAILRFWCDERTLITVRNTALSTVDGLRRAVETDPSDASAFGILLRLFRLFDGEFATLTERCESRLERVEDEILSERADERSGELGRLRRRLVQLRRLINPHRMAIRGLAATPPAWVGEDARDALHKAADDLSGHMQDLEHMQESARLLQEEQANRLAEVTNRNLYFLSILTAIFLPMTLVTGIFGMNVAGLPGLSGGGSFWWVILGLAATALASLMFLRFRRLL